VRLLEPPSAYAKGVGAMVVLSEILRISDLAVNWGFLSQTHGYRSFFEYDLSYVGVGGVIIVLSIVTTRYAIFSGLVYSPLGLLLTLTDPDFGHFIMSPIAYVLAMELPVSFLFTAGPLILVVMFVISVRGYQSLRPSKQFETD